ncbi:hypothetical protein [Mucilaginibacter pedocola]|uniref:Uncharacterized protein n=1 Tax=Mucilaginibacter pedocola TaxID=1792845 RepID=A0A1S9P766_9SPHI|nr:hypothetical protein [Mucilaginibacter pedocola]OOQ56802.1 hypothetical protein BC343_17610 [Mucilaginibacter pedocola]
MYKKFIYISVFNWLVIALVTSFPTANLFTHSCNAVRSGRKTEVVLPKAGDNAISNEVAGNDQSGDKNCKKKKDKVRFLVSRILSVSIVHNHFLLSLPDLIPANIAHLYTKYVLQRGSPPAYYGFLFRLSPF